MSLEVRHRVEQELFIRSFLSVNPTTRVTAQLINAMRDHTLPAGEVIYLQGEPATHIYFIVSGAVELSRAEDSGADAAWVLGDESVVGIIDALQERSYSRTARALRETQLIALEFSDYLDVLEDNFEYARQLLTASAMGSNELLLELGGNHVFATTNAPIGIKPSGPYCSKELNTMERLFALKSTPVFERAPVQALASLAHLATCKAFAGGESIFSIEEPTSEIYILVSGTAVLSLPNRRMRAEVAPTRVIGGLASLGYERHQYGAETLSECLMLVLAREDLFDVMEDHLGLLRSLLCQVSVERERIMDLRHASGQSPSAPPALGLRGGGPG